MTLRSIWKWLAVFVCVAAFAEAEIRTGTAQSRAYRSVTVADLIMGYVPPQELVEVVGDLRLVDNKLLLSLNHISAMMPMTVEADALAPDDLPKLKTQCSVPRGRPACQAKIRGEVTLIENRRRLIAHEIELQSLAPRN